MILEIDHWYLGYSQILKDCRENEEEKGSVLILCHADVDAISAARILAYMLRADEVPHQILPCMSYRQMDQLLQANVSGEANSIRSVIMINMGAARNLTRLFEGEEPVMDPTLVKVFVMDCRRPVHLANIHAGDNVVIFWDPVQNDDVPSDGDNLSGNAESSSSEEEEDSDDDSSMDSSDDEGENEFGLEPKKRHTIMRDENRELPEDPLTDVDQNQETDYDGDEESDTSKVKRRRMDTADTADDSEDDQSTSENPANEGEEADQSQPPLTPREIHNQRADRIMKYYGSGSFFGSPSAYVAHRISTQLRFGNIGDLLWLACVGVTDAYLHARLDVAGYSSLAIDLRGHCNRLFPNDMYTQVGQSVFAEHLSNSNDGKMTKIGFSENGRVLAETDFRFFLLRHTSLFDAMVHSEYIATRFQLHTARGMHKLKELLAKMGYPLEQCKQPFAFMQPNLRRRLQHQILEYGEEYGLENFDFTSFFRITGYQSLLSASDASYAAAALLECDSIGPASALDTDEEKMKQNFNLVFDALNSNGPTSVGLGAFSGEGSSITSLVNGGKVSSSTGIGAGIKLAIKLQRNIMATAASLIERNAITRLSHFRYAYITYTSRSEASGTRELPSTQTPNEDQKEHVFAKPLALSRLAYYLMDLHRENGKWAGSKARPLILLAENPVKNTYLVVGHEYPESSGMFLKNRFGAKFVLAAESMEGQFRLDSFDSNVIEVSSDDVQKFLEQLHYLMDNTM